MTMSNTVMMTMRMVRMMRMRKHLVNVSMHI